MMIGGVISEIESLCHYLLLNNNPIVWSLKKQSVISRSTSEVEYSYVANAISEVLWVVSLYNELDMHLSNIPIVWCHNTGLVALMDVAGTKPLTEKAFVHFRNKLGVISVMDVQTADDEVSVRLTLIMKSSGWSCVELILSRLCLLWVYLFCLCLHISSYFYEVWFSLIYYVLYTWVYHECVNSIHFTEWSKFICVVSVFFPGLECVVSYVLACASVVSFHA